MIAVLIVPLAVQWWSTWYPGSEPGGGGYIAQRMLAARNEKQAMAATLWFNIAHYAVRPWPWILVALASLIVYPELSDIRARFPYVDPSIIGHDLAYPAMLVFVPHGLLGLVVASLAAAYMSTISTHLNWGASYIVDDVYRRFVRPDASESHYVNVGRAVTFALMILACAPRALARPCHAGVSDPAADRRRHRPDLPVALVLVAHQCVGRDRRDGDLIPDRRVLAFRPCAARLCAARSDAALVIGVIVTTVGWLAVTLLTPPTDRAVLQSFYDRIRPSPAGWRRAVDTQRQAKTNGNIAARFLAWFLGCVAVYAALFATGYLLYGRLEIGLLCAAVAIASAYGLKRVIPKVGFLTAELRSEPRASRPHLLYS